jgi:hypothetical protein
MYFSKASKTLKAVCDEYRMTGIGSSSMCTESEMCYCISLGIESARRKQVLTVVSMEWSRLGLEKENAKWRRKHGIKSDGVCSNILGESHLAVEATLKRGLTARQ